MDDQPGFDELAAAEEILAALRARRQQLLLREAKQGYETPPSVLTEIDEYNSRIRAQEAEVERLKTEVAVDRFSLAEAQYREMLAIAWGTESGEPTVAGAAGLEVRRLMLGLSPERAKVLEKEIRAKLAREAFDRMPPIGRNDTIFSASKEGMQCIGRAIRLDPSITIEEILVRTPPDKPFAMGVFHRSLMIGNNIRPNSHESARFISFLMLVLDTLDRSGREVTQRELIGTPLE